jgi:hypothetical protein
LGSRVGYTTIFGMPNYQLILESVRSGWRRNLRAIWMLPAKEALHMPDILSVESPIQ